MSRGNRSSIAGDRRPRSSGLVVRFAAYTLPTDPLRNAYTSHSLDSIQPVRFARCLAHSVVFPQSAIESDKEMNRSGSFSCVVSHAAYAACDYYKNLLRLPLLFWGGPVPEKTLKPNF